MPRPFRARPKPADIRPELRRLMERACPFSRLLVFGKAAGFGIRDYFERKKLVPSPEVAQSVTSLRNESDGRGTPQGALRRVDKGGRGSPLACTASRAWPNG